MSLKKIDFLDSKIKEITDGMFFNCINLQEIIPSSIKVIYMFAFKRCISLTNIVIPSSVEAIESSAFEGCSLLKEIKIEPSSLKRIATFCFNVQHLK